MDFLSVQNVILFLQFIVSVVALIFLIKYVRSTEGIEKAANEQSEGLSKPVVTILANAMQSDKAFFEEMVAETTGQHVQLVNIGTGPAIKLKWSIDWTEKGNKGLKGDQQGFVPYLEAGKTLETSLPRVFLTGQIECSVRCSYRSISEAEYTSLAVLDQTKITKVEFKRSGTP
jgi:hypothetical protein